MFLFQWHFRKPLNPPLQSDPKLRDHRPTQTRKPKSGNNHHARKVGVSSAHSESRKGTPRGRAVSRLAATSQAAPNPVSASRKTRPSTTPAPYSQSTVKYSFWNDPAFSTDPRSNPHHSMSYYVSASADTGVSPSQKQPFYLIDDEHDSHYKFPQPLHDRPPEYRAKALGAPPSASMLAPPSLSTSSSTTSQTSTTSSTPRTPHTALPAVMPTTSPPALLYTQTTPALRHAEKPAMPPRSVTLPGAPQSQRAEVNATDNAKHRTATRTSRPKELDRIDELDETDPLGLPWHHGGPYEAITKFSRAKALQARLDQDDSHRHAGENGGTGQSRKVREDIRSSKDPAPAKTPKDVFDPRLFTPPHPLLRQAPNYDISGGLHVANRWHSSPQEVPVAPNPEPLYHDQNPAFSGRYAIDDHDSSLLDDRRTTAPDMSGRRTTSIDHNQVKTKPAPSKLVRHRKGSNGRRQETHRHFAERTNQEADHLSREPGPSKQFDSGQEQQHRNDLLETQHSAVSSDASQPLSLETSSPRRQAHDVDVQRPRESDPTSNTMNHSSGPSSSAPSVKTSSTSHGSTSNRYRNDAPIPHYLPKRLVMPTPLQPQQDSSQPRPQISTRYDRYVSRDKGGFQPRAQDIPMQPESRKLVRKRTDTPNAVIVDMLLDMNLEVTSSRSHEERETLPKRLLNKRRHHL